MQGLSKRKREILELAAQGWTDKAIASHLDIALETVLSHWKELRAQLGAPSRTAVLAQILSKAHDTEAALLEAEKNELLFQLAESNRMRAELDEANRKLEELTERQANLMGQAIAFSDRKLSTAAQRLDQLESLNRLSLQTRTVLHEGEYGASWRKYYMSESVNFIGYSAKQWTDGEVNFFDFMDPKYIERNIPQFAPFSKGSHRLALAYKVRTPEGDRHVLDLLTCEIPDDSGTGNYYGLSLDITDWADKIIDLVQKGHIEPSTVE